MKGSQLKLTLAIAGSRHYSDYSTFSRVVTDELERFQCSLIVTGDATGVDTMVLNYCIEHQRRFRVYCADSRTFERLERQGVDVIAVSDWLTYGKSAGPVRNAVMVDIADRLLLFNGGGPGSRSVKNLARSKGIEVEEWMIDASSISTRDIVGGTVVASVHGGSTFI